MKKHKYLDLVNEPKDVKSFKQKHLTGLAQDIRNFMIESVSKTGGHLGAGLGVVELTVALSKVFDFPKDDIMWDVGHQSYPYKIITGRKNRMATLRLKGGLSGFAKRSESEYDVFGAGHSSTSISAMVGLATAKKMAGEKSNTIAVIGDGAMSAGLAFEGLNNAKNLNGKFIVILNDNDMSISTPTGALSSYFSKMVSSSSWVGTRNNLKKIASYLPKKAFDVAGKIEEFARVGSEGLFFEELGFYYIGAVDGHDIETMTNILNNIKSIKIDKPILFHVKTKKGYGYLPAEKSDDKFHGIGKFCVESGIQEKSKNASSTFTDVFSKCLCEHAKENEKIVAITAAMPTGTGIDRFQKLYPERTFDVGIAEQHAVTFAAGMTLKGYKPFVSIYSTFLQRSFDQIIHDVAIQKLPVRFAIDRAGLVGADGSTHAGMFDIAFLSMIPNFIVMAPSDENELSRAISTSIEINDGPSAFRYPKGLGLGSIWQKISKPFEIGKGRIVKKGDKVAIISYGTRLKESLLAAKKIKDCHNFDITVVDARFAKPMDKKLVNEIFKNHELIVSIEEGISGGFSSKLMNYIHKHDLLKKAKFYPMHLPDSFQDHDDIYLQYEDAKLNAKHIFSVIENNISL